MNRYLAGVGRALLIRGDNLIGVAKTLTDSTFEFSVSSEDVRGGAANMLWGRYFHDSTLTATLTDAMFKLEYIAASLGTNIQSGGLSIAEEQVSASNRVITATQTPVATAGSVIGWYKLPSEETWQVATFNGKNISLTDPDVADGTTYCLKYFYQNEDARSIVLNANYIPDELHVVIINDLFSGDIATDPSNTSKVGRLITDLPRFQLDGNQNLSLTSSGAATTSLSGSALAVSDPNSCEEDDVYYGTMTEEIFGENWKDNVIAIAVPNLSNEITMNVGDFWTIPVYVVFGNGLPSVRKDNSNFLFNVQGGHLFVSETGVLQAATVSGSDPPSIVEITFSHGGKWFGCNLRVSVVS